MDVTASFSTLRNKIGWVYADVDSGQSTSLGRSRRRLCPCDKTQLLFISPHSDAVFFSVSALLLSLSPRLSPHVPGLLGGRLP